jgi:lysophospholipase L1-like esterase
VAAPSWSLSGPGQLDLFGQPIPTTVSFAGPVRPRLVLTHITLSEQLDQFASGPTAAAQALEHALVDGWEHFFAWQIAVAGVAAIVLFGALVGWLRRGWRRSLVVIAIGLVVTEALNVGAIMVTAYTAPAKLAQIDSLQDLVGGAPPPAVPGQAAAPHSPISKAVVVGDSTAAGIGNRLVEHPTATDRACGRSADSFAADLATANHWNVLNLACQGATVTDGVLGVQTRGDDVIPPQLAVAQRATSATAVIVSIGANDMEWSALTGLCAKSPVCDDKASTAYFTERLAAFTQTYLDLLKQLAALPHHPAVLVNQYYEPFGPDTACLEKDGITADKARVLSSRLADINNVLERGAETFHFTSVRPTFAGHALCSDQPFVQGAADKAPLHPTAAGELAIALADQQALTALADRPPGTPARSEPTPTTTAPTPIPAS